MARPSTTIPDDLVPGSLESRLTTNRLAKLLYDRSFRRVWEAQRGGGKAPADVWAAYEQAQADLHRSVLQVVFDAPVGTEIDTADMRLVVADRGIGSANASQIVLTGDGRGVRQGWHDGPETGDWVYYERYVNGVGRAAHGYVDPTSRGKTQTG